MGTRVIINLCRHGNEIIDMGTRVIINLCRHGNEIIDMGTRVIINLCRHGKSRVSINVFVSISKPIQLQRQTWHACIAQCMYMAGGWSGCVAIKGP